MPECKKCKKGVDTRERCAIRCFGKCKGIYHLTCVDLNHEKWSKFLKDCTFAKFVCIDCQKCEEYVVYEEIKIINTKVDELKSAIGEFNKNINVKVGELRAKVFESKDRRVQPTYAEALKNKPNKVVIIQPKSKQNNKKTKEDLTAQIDPTEIPVMGCRNAANGGVILHCDSNEAKEKIKDVAIKKLGKNYIIKTPAELNPRVKILRMTELIADDEVISSLKKQNEFLRDCTIKVVAILKRKNGIEFDAILETDAATYKRIMDAEKVNIRFDRCRVVDSIGITRCYKCNGFSHKASDCTNNTSCPRCAGEHKVSECKAEEVKCINCKTLNEKLNLNLSTNHTTWDKECVVLQRKIRALKQKINYQ